MPNIIKYFKIQSSEWLHAFIHSKKGNCHKSSQCLQTENTTAYTDVKLNFILNWINENKTNLNKINVSIIIFLFSILHIWQQKFPVCYIIWIITTNI